MGVLVFHGSDESPLQVLGVVGALEVVVSFFFHGYGSV